MSAVVVGAGLAGLAAAGTLQRAGQDVVVLEAGDEPGGRVRSDAVDGMVIDRGFQVLLTGYPELQREVDLDALQLRPFAPGVVVRAEGGFHALADPLRAPLRGLGAAFTPVVSIADGLRLLRLRVDLLRHDGEEVADRPQVTAAERLAQLGFSERAVERFFGPFLAGIFFDEDLTTSSRMLELIFRSFFRGEVAVPAAGMQALPDQLAGNLAPGTLRTSTPVARVERGVVRTEGGEAIEADHVVVAVDGPAAEDLLGEDAPEVAPGRGTTTLTYAAPRPPVEGPHLLLDGERAGPVNNLAVMSEVAEHYAAPGRAQVSASVVGVPDADDVELDRAARAQLRRWFGAQVDAWATVQVARIPYAQPRQEPRDLQRLARDVDLGGGLWVCGDHRDTASLQGAMVSGRRTAEQILTN